MKNPFVLLLMIVSVSAHATPSFSDNFNDGVINPNHWQVGGNGTTETGGTLRMQRDSASDYLQTVGTFSGNYVINFDIKLNSISWGDPFHGVSIVAPYYDTGTPLGMTFGFSIYGSLTLIQHLGGGFNNYSYAGRNQLGQWQHWTIQKSGMGLSIFVNQNLLFTGTIWDNAVLKFPGHFGGSPPGFTSSEIDNFSVVPEPSTASLFGLAVGVLALRGRRLLRRH